MKYAYIIFTVSVLLTLIGTPSVLADDADLFFDDSQVQEIRLTFTDPDWYSTLYSSHSNDPDDPYFPATFEYGDMILEQVGVRFKGNSSFNINSEKKSIKIDFNEYNEEMTFLGLKKINLNNGYKDPSLMRAKLFLDFTSQFIPAIRAVHTRVYINDEYLGLYTAVEQIDNTFCQDRFGEDEDGNLFKGAGSDDISGNDFYSDLTWLGSSPDPYYDYYQLKTNETENDYSQLITFIDILNNTSSSALPAQLEPIFDVSNGLMGLALNNLFTNLDSYSGSAHNYYLYNRDDTGQFTHIHWDTNEAFGTFTMFMSHMDNPLELDPFWLPESMGPPPPSDEDRPLMENLWAVDEYSKEYLRDLAYMLRNGFNASNFETRANELADIIRTDVYADNNKMYSNSQFETNLTSNVQDGMSTIYGIRYFVQERSDYLDNILDNYAEDSDMRLNEIMCLNTGTIQDSAGDYDPWIELYNLGPGEVNLSGLYLTNSSSNPTKWALPSVYLDDGDYLVIWLDNETSEGNTHANFSLNVLGGDLYLYEGSNLVDSISYPSMDADNSLIRLPDGTGEWELTDQGSPGSANLPSSEPVTLYINEFMADNDSTIQDPDEPGSFEDWIEIFNPNAFTVNLGGMYLTDDLTDPTQYVIPQGVEIEAGGFLIFWADDDSDQGDLHTNFKLAVAGESIGLFDTDLHSNQEIDSITFEAQTTDISYGRCPDGSNTWVFPDYASPGSSNCQDPTPTPTPPPGTPTPTPTPIDTPELYINEFMASNSTTIADEMGEYEDWIEIYNASSEMVDLSGMYLSDNEVLPTQWQFPDGSFLIPGEYMLIWCDNDEEQGDYHTNFKLSASGEYIGLYGSDSLANTLIDSIEFDEQITDISMGRCPDGSAYWQFFDTASPDSTNGTACNTPTPEPTQSDCINHGDVDLNETLTAGDAQLGFQIALGAHSPSYQEECAADCNGDGSVTAGDAQLIFFAVLGSGSCVDPL